MMQVDIMRLEAKSPQLFHIISPANGKYRRHLMAIAKKIAALQGFIGAQYRHLSSQGICYALKCVTVPSFRGLLRAARGLDVVMASLQGSSRSHH